MHVEAAAPASQPELAATVHEYHRDDAAAAEPAREPAPVEAAFVSQPEPEEAPPRREEPRAEPPARPAAPSWKMEDVSLPSDMVMIETQSKPATTPYQEEAPRPARTPRPRPQSPVVPDEPLQQVETRDGSPQGPGSA
jgi:hypothetical protein